MKFNENKQWPGGGVESFPEGDESPISTCPKCGEESEQDEFGRDFCRECYPALAAYNQPVAPKETK